MRHPRRLSPGIRKEPENSLGEENIQTGRIERRSQNHCLRDVVSPASEKEGYRAVIALSDETKHFLPLLTTLSTNKFKFYENRLSKMILSARSLELTTHFLLNIFMLSPLCSHQKR